MKQYEISDEDYSTKLKQMNMFCDDDCKECSANGDCFFADKRDNE